MALQTFNNGDSAPTVRAKLNALVAAVQGASPLYVEFAQALWPAWAGCVWSGVGAVGATGTGTKWIGLEYAGAGGRNLYKLHAPDSAQIYEATGAVKFNLPATFNQWSKTAHPLALEFFTTDATADCAVDVVVYRGDEVRAALMGQSAPNAWTSLVFTNTLIGDDWAAGDEITVEVTLRAKGSKVSCVGKLSLGLLLSDTGGKASFVYGLSGYGGSGGYGA